MSISPPRVSLLSVVLNVLRGVLIGMAELVPGISGGTVALVVGIYERALHAAHALLHCAKVLLRRPSEFKDAARAVDWGLLLPVGIGMAGAVFSLSSVLHAFVTHHPETSRGLFFGMVLMSLAVPLSMMAWRVPRRRQALYGLIILVGAALAFLSTSQVSEPHAHPPLIAIFFAASVAVCALVLPGVSGSLVLLAMGLYAPVMAAVSARHVPTLLAFAAGALLGLALFVRVLDYLMTRYRDLTLAAMGGLMLGSLRALWPWQDESGALSGPQDPVALPVLMVAVGMGVVLLVIAAEKWGLARAGSTATPSEKHPS